eukprot:7009187-Pyramimonas_sp.AAC.1
MKKSVEASGGAAPGTSSGDAAPGAPQGPLQATAAGSASGAAGSGGHISTALDTPLLPRETLTVEESQDYLDVSGLVGTWATQHVDDPIDFLGLGGDVSVDSTIHPVHRQ